MGAISKETRIDEIDIAKGLGIILVILGHLFPADSDIVSRIYSFHMPLFFILAGCVIRDNRISNSFRDSLRNESKIVSQYLLWSAVYVIYDIVYRVMISGTSLWLVFWDAYQSVSLFGINVLWFLCTLVLAKTIFLSVHVFRKRYSVFLSFLLFFVGAVAGKYLLDWMNSQILVYKLLYYPVIAILRSLNVILFIQIGFILKKYISTVLRWNNIGYFWVITIVWILLSSVPNQVDVHVLNYNIPVLLLCTAITGSAMVLGISFMINQIKIVKAVIIWFGHNSLLIMVTHEYLFVEDLGISVADMLSVPGTGFHLFVVVSVCLLFEVVLCMALAEPIKRITSFLSKGILHLI